MCQKTWNRLPWLVPPDPAEHNISHVSLSSELLAVKMPQLHRPDPRILRVLRTTDRNLTRCQDNHQRNGRQNCIGPVLAFTHSARRPRPQATTFPIPPLPPQEIVCLFALCIWKWNGKQEWELKWSRESQGKITLTQANALKHKRTHMRGKGKAQSHQRQVRLSPRTTLFSLNLQQQLNAIINCFLNNLLHLKHDLNCLTSNKVLNVKLYIYNIYIYSLHIKVISSGQFNPTIKLHNKSMKSWTKWDLWQ